MKKENDRERNTSPARAKQSPNTEDSLEAISSEGFISKLALAQRLSVSIRTVERWQRQGVIPYVKCGRIILFKWTDVEANLQKYIHASLLK